MSTGYVSIADLPGTVQIITGTGTFQPLTFEGVQLVGCAEGPNLIQAQLYFYPVTGTRPRGWILQTMRGNGDPTADQACFWPSDWPFSYLPVLYGPAIDFASPGNTDRGVYINVPTGTKLGLKAHIVKVLNPAAYIAARITAEQGD